MNNIDRIKLDICGHDYKVIIEGLQCLYNEKLKHTPWVGKPRYEGYGAPLDYGYEGNKETRGIQQLIKYLNRQVK